MQISWGIAWRYTRISFNDLFPSHLSQTPQCEWGTALKLPQACQTPPKQRRQPCWKGGPSPTLTVLQASRLVPAQGARGMRWVCAVISDLRSLTLSQWNGGNKLQEKIYIYSKNWPGHRVAWWREGRRLHPICQCGIPWWSCCFKHLRHWTRLDLSYFSLWFSGLWWREPDSSWYKRASPVFVVVVFGCCEPSSC